MPSKLQNPFKEVDNLPSKSLSLGHNVHSPAEKLDTPCHIKTVWTWAWAQVWDWEECNPILQNCNGETAFGVCYWFEVKWEGHGLFISRASKKAHVFQGISFYTIPAMLTPKCWISIEETTAWRKTALKGLPFLEKEQLLPIYTCLAVLWATIYWLGNILKDTQKCVCAAK